MSDVEELGPVFESGQPNEAVHPAQFQHKGSWGESPALKRAFDVASSTYDKLATLHEYRTNRSEEAHQHAQKLKHGVDELGRNFAAQWQEIKTGLKREKLSVEAGLKTKANLVPSKELLNATLGTFQSMTEQQRSQAIDELLEEGAGPVLAILAETPGVLTGISKEQREGIVTRAYLKADANSYELLGQLDKALVRAERASLAAIDMQLKLVSGTDRFAKKVERSKQLENQLRLSA